MRDLERLTPRSRDACRRRCRTLASLSLALFWIAGTTGCAKYQYVNVRSEPEGALVFVDGELLGRTPLRVSVQRTRDHIVFLKLDGHIPEREVLRLNRAPDQIDFLTPADVELRLGRRLQAGDPTRDVELELEKEDSSTR